MPDNPSTLRDNHFPRRWFLKSAGVATATAALGMVPGMAPCVRYRANQGEA